MTTAPRPGAPTPRRFLVENRLAVYLGGLVAILLPRILRTFFDVTLEPLTRTVIVALSLLLMIVTYLAERRARSAGAIGGAGDPGDAAGASEADYPLRTRVLVAAVVIGVAVGIYVALEVDLLWGLLFLLGAFFFARVAYRDDGRSAEGED